MFILILTIIVGSRTIKAISNDDFRNCSERFVFLNLLQKISVDFNSINAAKEFLLFHGENCTIYLYKKTEHFELQISNGYNQEIYISPLDKKLYFETNPFRINGDLMSLNFTQGSVHCVGFEYLAILAGISRFSISDSLEQSLGYKKDRIDLLAFLIAIPLSIIIILTNRDYLMNNLGLKKYTSTSQETDI